MKRQYRSPRAGEVLSLLNSLGIQARPEEGRRGPEVRFNPSPCCGRDKRTHPAACINTATGLWRCHACQKTGNWFTLTRALGAPLAEDDRYTDHAPAVDFRVYDAIRARLRRPVTAGHHPALLAACHARGITSATLDAWRVTTRGAEVLRWPLFAKDEAGAWRMANARCRVVIDREKEGRTGALDWFEVSGGPTQLCLGNHLLGKDPARNYATSPADKRDGADPARDAPGAVQSIAGPFAAPKRVLITEGQWDAMTAWQLGIPNALSLPNGAAHVNVASMLRYVPDDYEVWLALDMDKAGDLAAELFFAQLGPDRIARLYLPHKDLNAWLMAEPTLTAAQVLATVKGFTQQASEVPRDPWAAQRADVIASVGNEGFHNLADFDEAAAAAKPDTIISDTPWPRFTDRLYGGFKGGQTTGVLAPSGLGKTTIVNQMAIHAAKNETKVGIVSLESTKEAVLLKLRQQTRGWTGYEGDMLRPVMSRILVAPLHGTEVTWQQAVEWLDLMATKGARLLVLDNLDYIMPRQAANASAIKLAAYAKVQDLCKRHNVHCLVVWQPNKIDRDLVINSGNQKGMAQAFQDADNYINLNKFGALRRIELEKNRAEGVLDANRHIWIRYDEATKCCHEVDHQADLSTVDKSGFGWRPDV